MRAVAAAACVPATTVVPGTSADGAVAGAGVDVDVVAGATGVGVVVVVVVVVVGGGVGDEHRSCLWSSAGEFGARTLPSTVSVFAHHENASIVCVLSSAIV